MLRSILTVLLALPTALPGAFATQTGIRSLEDRVARLVSPGIRRIDKHLARIEQKLPSLPELYNAFLNENYWVNKQTILGSIGKIGNPNSIPFLEEHARYAGESAVRLSAARALSRIGTPLAMNTLRDVARAESDEKIQSYMINWSQEQQ